MTVLSKAALTCPQTRDQVLNMYFLEHRAKLLDVAAFLDRLDRAKPVSESVDFREAALHRAIRILIDGETHRAARILGLFSDESTHLPQSAHGMKGASGAAKTVSGDSR